MNSVWISLLWKEWREHRWKLAALSAMFLAVPLISSLRTPSNFSGAVSLEFFILVPLTSMFVAMNIAAGEQSRKTLHFLESLPVPMSKPAAAKLLLAMATVVAPVLLTVGAVAIWNMLFGGRDLVEALAFDRSAYGTAWLIDNWYAARACAGAFAAVSILLWMAAGGVNRSDEVRAGAVGLLAMLVCWAALAFLPLVFEGVSLHWKKVLIAAAPGGVAAIEPRLLPANLKLGLADWMSRIWPFAAAAIVSHGALAIWFVRRYGRTTAANRQAAETTSRATEKGWLGSPRSRPLTAILWKQWRESAPLAALAAAAIVAAAIAFASYTAWQNEPHAMGVLAVAATACWGSVGVFVAVVAGIGVFMDDMRPRLHAFWRSRPINVDQWFVVKFLAGMLITLGILAWPPLLIGALSRLIGAKLPPNAVYEYLEFSGVMLAVQAGMYTAAVLAIVLVRQAIYAAILTIAAVGVFMASLQYFLPSVSNVVLVSGAAAIGAMLFAWFTVRRDWGWKG